MVIILFSLGLIIADGEETFALAEEIIKQKIPCDELSENQLEILGDYYMEQMHPGELHEIMDERMGGEDSESLRQIHINMGLTFYCGEHEVMPVRMMNMMMGRNYYYGTSNFLIFNWIITILIAVFLILLIIFLIKQIQK